MMDIVMLVVFVMWKNADDWAEREAFGREHEDFLRNYLELPNGIPSHDTIQRVYVIVPPEFLENFQKKWNEMVNSGDGHKIKNFLLLMARHREETAVKTRKLILLSVP